MDKNNANNLNNSIDSDSWNVLAELGNSKPRFSSLAQNALFEVFANREEKAKINSVFEQVLQVVSVRLQKDLGQQIRELNFQPDSYSVFCQFSQWCLTDPECGLLQYVTRDQELRSEIIKLADLCKYVSLDTEAWKERGRQLMFIAMSDSGGDEARVTDAAYLIARTFELRDLEQAGMAIYVMLRLQDADKLLAKLEKLSDLCKLHQRLNYPD